MALLMTVRRAQERAQSLNTGLPSVQFSRPETKHCSAFSESAVSRSASKYKFSMSSLKTRQKSEVDAYRSASLLCRKRTSLVIGLHSLANAFVSIRTEALCCTCGQAAGADVW